MQIHIDTISKKGLFFEKKEPFESFQGLVEMDREKECRFHSPIHIKIDINKVQQYFVMTGTLHVEVGLTCSRCLCAYRHDLSAPFSATFSQGSPEPAESTSELEVEWSGEDSDHYYFHGDVIDLGGAIQEQLLLSLPVKPLCGAECKGLCNGCGVDLNRTACSCKNEAVDPRFAILKNLKIE